MFFRILQKDFKRKRGMNFILLLFMCLASLFVSSGLNNVLTVINGTDYYFDQAGLGDYAIITIGTKDVKAITDALGKEETITDYRVEEAFFASQDSVKTGSGKKVTTKNIGVFQSIEHAALNFFDTDNKKIETIYPGEVYVTGNFIKNNGLRIGDDIVIKLGNTEVTLTIAGKAKDALLGSDFMGNTRFLMSEEDHQKFYADESIDVGYFGQFTYIDSENIQELMRAVNEIPNVNFDGARSTIQLCYVLDLIIAFIVLILSVCLIVVALVVLKFIISLTITEEFREIGVMKAIGMSNLSIRGIYLVKYFCMAALAAVIGFIFSIPFSKLLLQSVSENMVLGNEGGLLLNGIGAILLVAVILLFALRCTGKIKKVTPIDAIRSGQSGERYRKKSPYRIGKSLGGNSIYLAVNDILSRPKQYITVMISFFLCTSLVLLVANTISTMRSDALIYSFGAKSDLWMVDVGSSMENMGAGKEGLRSFLEEKEAELEEEGMMAKVFVDVFYKYNLSFEGREYKISCMQGVDTKAAEYQYSEGYAPKNKDEIAITPQVSAMTGAKIGDTVMIDFGTEKRECMVTAYFETMNLLGEAIRLHEEADTDFAYIANIMHLQITFTDAPTQEEIELRKERLKELYDNDKVMNAAEFCEDCTQVAGTLDGVKALLLAITLIVVMLVTILMEQSFLANEKSQIALLKAIGFRDDFVVRYHVCRFGIVALAAVLLAAVCSIPLTDLCISPVFGMMGQRDIDFHIEYLDIFVMYPAIVLAITVFFAWLTAQGSRKIKSRDTANIE